MQGTMPCASRREDHARPGSTTSIRYEYDKFNLALSALTFRNYIVKRAIPHREQSEVCCLLLLCSVRRYKHGNQSKSLDTLLQSLLDYIAVDLLRRSMPPIVTDRVAWSVGMSVGLSPSEP